MNKLKFRVWDKISQTLIYDDLSPYYYHIPRSLDGNDVMGDANLHDLSDLLNNPDFVVQQYVGIKDKNNVEIFEGDIIINDIDGEEYCSPSVVSFSVYEQLHWALFMKFKNVESYHVQLMKEFNGVKLYEEWPLSYFNVYGYTVVGNIFQNLELIKA